ncbi:multiple epidermal growth factor-like domains protein 8 [Acanthaster planci]|uniref:Multiple epidermal growth factor-like domains protein 8 n=1 Tax=Acanthaster planci TaxID=133434 RepID=A0A8B7Z278_ACAPL|nr:multiple epidermal growth factor-like domains protein 8 [Acanthaster planci]
MRNCGRLERSKKVMDGALSTAACLVLLLICACGRLALAAGCSGLRRVLLTDLEGTVTDGSGFYDENVHCEWLIEAPDPNMTITLTFKEFETECTYDFVTIYDGDTFTSTVLGTYSGNLLPGPVQAKSGKMLIHLYSDTNYPLNGTTATYTIQNCSNACSGHGVCQNYKCVCESGYKGDSCEGRSCPYECGQSASRGNCDFTTLMPQCTCNAGFVGEGCSLSTNDNTGWGDTVLVSSGIQSVFRARTGHTAQYHEGTDSLWVFGGYDLNSVLDDIVRYNFTSNQWEEVVPTSGPRPAGRYAHSMVLYSDELIVFGGVLSNGSLTNELWSFDVKTQAWTLLPTGDDAAAVPPGLADHTGTIVNFSHLYVFGGEFVTDLMQSVLSESYDHTSGNVHRHYSDPAQHRPLTHERCYDDRVELFHLGCHKWTDFDTLAEGFQSPAETEHLHVVTRGRFGHAAAVRDSSTLLVVGGYSGLVHRDLIAVKMPGTVALNSKSGGSILEQCLAHSTKSVCLSDPNCGWCNANSNCIGHSQHSNCTEPLTFDPDTCPSVCDSLVTCEACIVWGTGAVTSDPTGARVNEQCGWCVQEQECYPLGEPGGACGDQSSHSDPSGWWGINGTFLAEFSQCRLQDTPPGITWIKYRHPQNTSQPDEVTIVETTDQNFNFYYVSIQQEKLNGGSYIAEYKGFLRPNGAVPTGGALLQVWMGSSNAISTLHLSRDERPENAEKVAYYALEEEEFVKAIREDGSAIFPDTSAAYYVRQEERQVVTLDHPLISVMDLKWNGNMPTSQMSQPFEKEYLQPFYSGSCENYVTCSGCLTDASCGWCPTSRTCELRSQTAAAEDHCGTVTGAITHHLVTSWDQCVDCGLYVDCLSCTENPLCEWLISGDDTRCLRRGRFSDSITDPGQCTLPCHEYTNCSDCSKSTKECAWCEETKTCFTFGTYVTSYTYGQCPNWFDQKKACPSCSAHTDCKSCLANFQCGWCGNRDNPTLGNCQEGSFGGPDSGQSCTVLVASQHNVSESEPADWSYGVCPDVEECQLGLDDCHDNATCANTFDAYECTCDRGFEGNGRDECVKTCYHECVYGHCSGAPDYTCICDVGWTGENCSTDCECNFHSTCTTGIGVCDECQHWTMGQYCELCRPGSYGNATDQSLGCLECQCNGHGDPTHGRCHNVTGICYCIENSRGEHCEECVVGFYHDPRFPQHCSHECRGRMLLTNAESAALGSGQGDGVSPPQAYCLWVLTAGDNLTHTAAMANPPTISLTMEGIEALCGRDYVYVYDGIPAHLSLSHPENAGTNMGAFCGQDLLERVSTVAHSGTMTVVYQANHTGSTDSPGFVASYSVNRCPDDCRGNRECILGACRCASGYWGPDCELELCPANCSEADSQGICDKEMGVCNCSEGFGGEACQYPTSPLAGLRRGVWTLLADEARVDPDASSTVGAVPCSRMGHTVVASEANMLWLFGGYSHAHGDLNDVWSYDLSTKTWKQHFSGSAAHPAPRRYHAATFASSYMMISGGMNDTTVMQDVWYFHTVSENWSQIPAIFPVGLAGHSFVVVRDDTMVTVGGYSPIDGLQDKVLEFSLADNAWLAVPTTGTPPTGLFGHSTVWHPATKALYVYGGYLFHLDSVFVSDRLYSLDYRDSLKKWNLLPAEPGNQPLPHIFHAAVTTTNYMVVLGGGTPTQNISNTLMAYHYLCNHWIDLSDFVVGSPPSPSTSLAAAVTVDDTIYTFGGNDGTSLGALHRLSLPADLCTLQTTADGCRGTPGCGACVETNNTQNLLFCKSNLDLFPESCSGEYTLEQGTVCDNARVEFRNCRAARSCSECVMTQPAHHLAEQTCMWCSNCPDGACISRQLDCMEEHNCQVDKQKEISDSDQCPELECEASDCAKCVLGNCIWTRQFKRASEVRRLLNANPTYDWNCFRDSLLQIAPADIHISSSPTEPCPAPCHTHRTCLDCLDTKGADGAWQECVWSSRLGECFSPTYLPLICSTGACGPLARSGTQNCPQPCYLHTQCAHCLGQPGCGWCAVGPPGNGTGVCMEGGLYQPTGGTCSAEGVTLKDYDVNEFVTFTPVNFQEPPLWTFMACPPENECLNGHHDCRENEECNDTLTSYECNCKAGYEQESEGSACLPVCNPPCQNGICIRPDVCLCNFGHVGADCAVECECNGHSTCAGPEPHNRTNCLQCMNNTQGQSCDKCLPFFVGDPTNGGQCMPCFAYCHGNSDICLSEENFNRTRDEGLQLDLISVPVEFPVGPVTNAVCVNCRNYSAGQMCETCIDGYFKDGNHCQVCQCNGHWDRCDKTSGEDCQCKNNTDTPSCPTERYPAPCWAHQCSICEELFIGEPTDGRQCYRQMHVDQDTCFDPETQTNCPLDSVPLPFGRASFFVVQPKFTNLDIRLTVDVTAGALDVYITHSFDYLRVATNRTTGEHSVSLEGANLYEEAYRAKRRTKGLPRERRNVPQELEVGEQALTSSVAPPVYNTLTEYAATDNINTFVNIDDPNFVAIVRGLRNRLVVTLPEDVHSLKTKKFFITLLSREIADGMGTPSLEEGVGAAAATSGIMYFRQDQPHIDLFVFFSVFLSCFFLFLAILVVAWKVKVALEVRNDRQRRALELEHRASRPIGDVLLHVEGLPSGTWVTPAAAATVPPRKHSRMKRGASECHPGSRPTSPTKLLTCGLIACEPTEDDMAAVATTIISLPGGAPAPVQACLGSALILMKPSARPNDPPPSQLRPVRFPSGGKSGMCREMRT